MYDAGAATLRPWHTAGRLAELDPSPALAVPLVCVREDVPALEVLALAHGRGRVPEIPIATGEAPVEDVDDRVVRAKAGGERAVGEVTDDATAPRRDDRTPPARDEVDTLVGLLELIARPVREPPAGG